MKTATMLILMLFAVQFDEARAKTTATRRIVDGTVSLYTALKPAAQGGNPQKIQEIIAHPSKYGTTIDEKDLSWLLLYVAKSGNPESIDLLVKFADERHHPFKGYGDFGRMVKGAAQSGKHAAVDLVVRLADKYRLPIHADDFTSTMVWAANKGDTPTIKHIYTIVTEREIKLNTEDYSYVLPRKAAQSGDPQIIALIDEIATAQGFRIADDGWSMSIKEAAAKNYRVLEQVMAIVNNHDIKIERKYLVDALTRAAQNYSGYKVASLEVDTGNKPGYKTIEMVIDFATKQGDALHADDFGQAMASAAGSGNKGGVEKILELASKHGVILTRKHFVAVMMQRSTLKTMPRSEITMMRYTAKLADDYGIVFSGNDFFEVVLSAVRNFRYNNIPHIVDLSNKHDAKLEGKHFSQLLAEATNGWVADKKVKEHADIVMQLVKQQYGVEVDNEYFDTAIAYALKKNDHFAAGRIKKIAQEHGL